MRFLSSRDYMSGCKRRKKLDEEREFSEEELKLIREETLRSRLTVRTLMRLFAMETGLRAGELPVVYKSDIRNGFIHVHRQQRKDWDDNGRGIFVELPYTKDERMYPHNGRLVPITQQAQGIINKALKLPGESDLLFHENGRMISKESYIRNLARFCKRIGLTTTNNHAFRMAFNSRMIELGFSSADRALILGHEVQTNETIYSLTDRRRLEQIKARLQ